MENEERKEAQQEGIEVIIRIKPRTEESADEDFRKCVFMSPTEENTIVVETQNKKEFFSFDHIASEESQQDQIYDSIGQPVLEESFKVPPIENSGLQLLHLRLWTDRRRENPLDPG